MSPTESHYDNFSPHLLVEDCSAQRLINSIAYYSHANYAETVSEISGCTDIIKVLQKCNFTLMEDVTSPKTFRCKSRVFCFFLNKV